MRPSSGSAPVAVHGPLCSRSSSQRRPSGRRAHRSRRRRSPAPPSRSSRSRFPRSWGPASAARSSPSACRSSSKRSFPTRSTPASPRRSTPGRSSGGYAVRGRPARSPGFTIEARRFVPTKVKYVNELVGPGGGPPFLQRYLPVDQTLHWADPLGLGCFLEHRGRELLRPVPRAGPRGDAPARRRGALRVRRRPGPVVHAGRAARRRGPDPVPDRRERRGLPVPQLPGGDHAVVPRPRAGDDAAQRVRGPRGLLSRPRSLGHRPRRQPGAPPGGGAGDRARDPGSPVRHQRPAPPSDRADEPRGASVLVAGVLRRRHRRERRDLAVPGGGAAPLPPPHPERVQRALVPPDAAGRVRHARPGDLADRDRRRPAGRARADRAPGPADDWARRARRRHRGLLAGPGGRGADARERRARPVPRRRSRRSRHDRPHPAAPARGQGLRPTRRAIRRSGPRGSRSARPGTRRAAGRRRGGRTGSTGSPAPAACARSSRWCASRASTERSRPGSA